MDIEALRTLIAIQETGSLLAAAKRLRVARSSARRRIEALEAEVGGPLVHYDRNGARLTESGEFMARRSRELVRDATAMLKLTRGHGRAIEGELRLMLPPGAPPHVSAMIFGALRSAYPDLRLVVRIHDGDAAELPDDVDALIQIGAPPPRGAWVSVVLSRVPVGLFASDGYVKARGLPTTLDELAEHDVVGWLRPGEVTREIPLADGTTREFTPYLLTSDIMLARSIALGGQAIALIPEGGVPDLHTPTGPLQPVLPELVASEAHVRALVPEGIAKLPRLRALMDLIKSRQGGKPRP